MVQLGWRSQAIAAGTNTNPFFCCTRNERRFSALNTTISRLHTRGPEDFQIPFATRVKATSSSRCIERWAPIGAETVFFTTWTRAFILRTAPGFVRVRKGTSSRASSAFQAHPSKLRAAIWRGIGGHSDDPPQTIVKKTCGGRSPTEFTTSEHARDAASSSSTSPITGNFDCPKGFRTLFRRR